MTTKKVMQRNLSLIENYTFVSAKYISILDGGGCTCDNCGKLISNIVTIKDGNNNFYNVGSDCAETLQSLQNDFNYFQNKDCFNEGKQIRAKIQKYIKKQNGSRFDVVEFYLWYSKENEVYLVFKTKDGGSSMQQIYYKDITINYIKDLLTKLN
jgi:hypothetical protein